MNETMNEILTVAEKPVCMAPGVERRRNEPELLGLLAMDPAELVEGARVGDAYRSKDFFMAGAMRETCPHCMTTHLKMVLLQKGVKRAHVFCENCTRCFDACYDGGPSVLL
ncbi:hypothetical protein BH11PSE11_BH11PSE11_30580 [soil metagenome]